MTGVFIVEDDERMRRHLVELLDGEPGLRVLGSATSAEAALKGWPDGVKVALIDLGLPGMSGVELIGRLAERPGLQVIAHTVHDDRPTVLAAIKAGAVGYLLKGTTAAELVSALTDVERGGSPMSPAIARAVLRELQGGSTGPDPLSPRERQVLQRLDQGKSYKEAASELHISENTVHTHVKHIYERLRVEGRQGALAEARRRGLI